MRVLKVTTVAFGLHLGADHKNRNRGQTICFSVWSLTYVDAQVLRVLKVTLVNLDLYLGEDHKNRTRGLTLSLFVWSFT
jgi:hypothetical protein